MKEEPRITIQLRINANDKEFIEQKARALGLSVSAFVRIATLTYKIRRGPLPPSIGTPDDRQTLRSEVYRYDKRTTDK